MTTATLVRSTSIDAYRAMAPRLSNQQQRIVEWLARNCHKAWTRREVATAIGMETATMSARVNALMKLGIVVETGTKVDPVSGLEVGAVTLQPFQADMFA